MHLAAIADSTADPLSPILFITSLFLSPNNYEILLHIL